MSRDLLAALGAAIDAARAERQAERIENPGPHKGWPNPEYVTPDMEGPARGTLLPCGCHQRLPDYEAVLCAEHLTELNEPTP